MQFVETCKGILRFSMVSGPLVVCDLSANCDLRWPNTRRDMIFRVILKVVLKWHYFWIKLQTRSQPPRLWWKEKEKETEIYYTLAEDAVSGVGKPDPYKRGRLGDPGGLITRRAVSTFAFSTWPQVQINPPLLIFHEEVKNHLAINFDPRLKPDDFFSIPYLWTGLVKCLWDFGVGT